MGTPLAPYGLVGGKLFEPVCKPFRVYHVHPVTRGDSFTPVIVPVILKVKILPELVINVKTIEHGEVEMTTAMSRASPSLRQVLSKFQRMASGLSIGARAFSMTFIPDSGYSTIWAPTSLARVSRGTPLTFLAWARNSLKFIFVTS